MPAGETSHDVDVLRRWEAFGAVWQVVHRDASHVTISLRRCDGGEEVERFTSSDPELFAYLRQHPT